MSTLFKRILYANIGLYVVGNLLAHSIPKDCFGWECDLVVCPNNYAVMVPDKGYLKCEDFDKYVETHDESLIIKVSF